MRVIAGSAGGLNLQAPGKGTGTRPTMDKVRGAIFSSLGDRVPEARVLDLFAGSGALGIEALSRGAASVTFVEHHGPTAGLIRKNLQTTHLEGSVQQMDVFRFLDLYAAAGSLDLILADPPYVKGSRESKETAENPANALLAHPALQSALAPDALLILECERRQPLPSLHAWEILSDRSYGESRILILRKVEALKNKTQ
jgi:16S rRNA (guanine(966)-N(2))-methyltransferase RsmD